MKVEFYGQIFKKKSSNIKFHENPPSGSRVPCGRTDVRTTVQIVAFRNFANAPKNGVVLSDSVYCPGPSAVKCVSSKPDLQTAHHRSKTKVLLRSRGHI